MSWTSHATCSSLLTVATLYLRGTHPIYVFDRSCPSYRGSHGVTHTSLIAITYLITDHDHLPDRDRVADSGSKGVLHTNRITITYLIPSYYLYRIRFLSPPDRDRLADRGCLLDRLITNVTSQCQ